MAYFESYVSKICAAEKGKDSFVNAVWWNNHFLPPLDCKIWYPLESCICYLNMYQMDCLEKEKVSK